MLISLVTTLRAAVETAKNRWTGLDWQDDESDICVVADMLEAGKPLRVDYITSWVSTDCRYSTHRQLLPTVLTLYMEGCTIAAARLARKLADESAAYVKGRATEAAEHGAAAVAAAEAGNWSEAVRELEKACAREREFGDDPAWGTALRTAEAARKGAESGTDAVATMLDEQGRDAVIATLKPGRESWDWAAINARAHRHYDIQDAYAEVYYTAYTTAARSRVEEIAATVYTYSVFDGNPNTGADVWPSHNGREIEADSVEEAIETASDAIAACAARLSTDDGYKVGQVIYGHVWDANGTLVGTPTYTLTAEDLGVDAEDDADEAVHEMVDALKHLADVTVRDGCGLIIDYAPDSNESPYDGETEPGSVWDEECDRLLSEVREALPAGWSAEWSDNDVVIERS